MSQNKNQRLVGGVLLILFGIGLFIIRLLPIADYWSEYFTGWPMILVGLAVAFLVLGLLTGAADMAVPACVVAGLGGIFLYQNNTQDWGSWSYIWSLIPGFVGLGIILSGLLRWKFHGEIQEGLRLILISAILFIIFGALFGGVHILGEYWPVILILLGLWIVVRNLIHR
jgi:hypothetical protein